MPPHDNAGTVIRVPLHSRKYPDLYALIDPEDADLVNQYRWCPSHTRHTVYAISFTNGVRLSMHRLILGIGVGKVADHINGDGLDNRRLNLRSATPSQNNANQTHKGSGSFSSFRGVSFKTGRTGRLLKWRADICVADKRRFLGNFDTEIGAALAYDAAARELHGEFARLNFPQEGEQAA